MLDNIDEISGVSTVQEIAAHLEKRRNVLTGFVLSGGEALLSPYLELLIAEAKKLGYQIKIDTNGTNPEKLEYLLNSPELKPDFVAMDIKTSPSKMGLLVPHINDKDFINALSEKVRRKPRP